MRLNLFEHKGQKMKAGFDGIFSVKVSSRKKTW